MAKKNRLIAASIVAIVLILVLGIWHVQAFRSSLRAFRDQGQEIGTRVT